MAALNAQSVQGTRQRVKRTKIAQFLYEKDIDLMFLTETWLRKTGDEAAKADLEPRGYRLESAPRLTRGGGVAVIYKDVFKPHISFVSKFPFEHSAFELLQINLALPDKTIHMTIRNMMHQLLHCPASFPVWRLHLSFIEVFHFCPEQRW